MKKAVILQAFLIVVIKLAAQTTIIPYGSSWKYLDNGSDPGTAWRLASFNDALWAAGNGQLGYGDGDEATTLSYGTNSASKYITTYFRKVVNIVNVSQYSGYALSVKRDDGIVIYINGIEVYRNNMPTGTIASTTLASASASDDGATAQTSSLNATAFTEGSNTIAVEVHQSTGSSSDISFDLLLTGTVVPTSGDIIPYGAAWKYLANGSNQGTAWTSTAFSDASWTNGNAQLGYGDGDEATVVSYGSNANSKYITTYFRKTVTIPNAAAYTSYSLNLKRDDGAIVYINGTERYRTNLPTGTISYTTLASAAASDDGATAQTATLSSSFFVNGSNTIAVEMHQNSVTSSDLSFDLQLAGNSGTPTTQLTRGPYLQMGNESAVTLRWRTSTATNSRLEAGTIFGTYPLVVNDATLTTEHEIRITGLTSDTRYYYRFGSSSQLLQAANDNYFMTAPPATAKRKIRIAAFGDCGRNDNTYQSSTLTSYLNYTSSARAEALFLLGDNAYDNGTDAEFQTQYFNIYSSNILRNHQLFPSPGNHEYANTAARQVDHNIPYNSIFSIPSAAQSGGIASGTESYYSWNWGNVHFLSLDSYGLENSGTTRLYDTTGAQVVWLKQDLAANNRPWVIAYWHHPPYSMGSNNSDTNTDLIKLRQNLIRILERMGVDLIVCGHSHDYERSYLLKGYYGNEASFTTGAYALSNSSAKYDGSTNSCPYTTVSGPGHGTVYVVAGSSGASGGVQTGYPHNALPFAVNDGGMLLLEIEDNRLDAKFIRRTGVVWDNFTVMKNVNKTTNIISTPGATVQLTASWPGSYKWSTGATTKAIQVSPSVNTSYTVTDGTQAGCIKDSFYVNVTGSQRTMIVSQLTGQKEDEEMLKIIPTIVRKGEAVTIQTNVKNAVEVIVIDVNGRIVQTEEFTNKGVLQTGRLQNGIYFLQLKGIHISHARKLIVIN